MTEKIIETKGSTQRGTLDNLLIALQKTLSRVNRASSGIDEKQARSLIVGDVNFNLTCKCDLADEDKLKLNDLGGVALSLSGYINTDIGVVRLQEDTDAPST